MKKALFSTVFTFIVLFFSLIGCKKNDTNDETSLQATITTNSADQSNIQSDDDAVAYDATVAADKVANFNATAIGTSQLDSTSISGGVLDKSPLANGAKRLFVRYGRPHLGSIKGGKVTIELVNGTKWSDSGAIIRVTFDTVKIIVNGKTRIYQGVRYITNVSGGNLYGNSFIGTHVYKVHAYGSVTFEDNSVRNYWITRKNGFIINSLTDISFTSEGDTTIAGDKYTMGGDTRFGKAFTVKDSQQYVSTKSCSNYTHPSKGIRTYTSDNRSYTITFGVNALGNQVTSGCADYYKLSWTRYNGQNATAIISY